MDSISTFKAVVIKDGKTKIIDVEKRDLQENEVFIRVEAAPINPSDRHLIDGEYGIKELQKIPEEGQGIGFEASGEIIDAHENAKALIGKRVAFSQDVHSPTYTGVWRQYVYMDMKSVIPFPDDVDYDLICSNFVNPLTACGFVDIAQKNGHKAIVQSAACSSVGKMLVRLCNKLEIPLINIVRREEQAKMLEELGAVHIVNSSSDTYFEDLKNLAEQLSATVFYDSVGGGKDTQIALDALPSGSTVYVYGLLSGQDITYNAGKMIFGQKTISFFWLGVWLRSLKSDEERKKWIGQVIMDLQQPEDKSIFRTSIAATYPLSQLEEALTASVEKASDGKTILKPQLE